MVELKGRKCGADLMESSICLAGRSFDAGKEIIDTLMQTDFSSLSLDSPGCDGEIYFSVGEKEAIVKRVKISPLEGFDPEKLALFELQSCLPEDPGRYYFESCRFDGRPERLAVAYPRNIIDNKINLFESKIARPGGFRLRALALSAGFQRYCRLAGGELICLLDVNSDEITYCFLDDKHPVKTGSLFYENHRLPEKSFLPSEALIDLAATLQYQTSLLFQAGFSVPLSLIVLSGMKADEELAAQIEKNTRVKTILPSIRKELFRSDLSAIAHKYLVSLGLTVDL